MEVAESLWSSCPDVLARFYSGLLTDAEQDALAAAWGELPDESFQSVHNTEPIL